MSKEPCTSVILEGEGFSQALESCRDYLLILARLRMGKQLQGKFDPADLVQQSLLEAHQARAKFRGQTTAELRAWLRLILAHHIGMTLRALGTAKRSADRERSLQDALDASSARLEAWLAAPHTSPTQKAQKHEQVEQLASALAALPEAQRDALVLKHCQGWTVAVIAEHLGRSPEAVAGLLKRGAHQLRALMQ